MSTITPRYEISSFRGMVTKYTMQGVSQGYGDGRLLRSNTLPTPWGRPEYRAPNKNSIIRGSLSPDREEAQFQISGPERLSGKVSYSSGPWQDEEDNILLNARSRGHGWKQIQTEYFPSKSSNACRKRYERLIAKKRGSSWDEAKFEKLGILYKQLREQIWMPLADAMDESWEDVEKACFGRGLRSLKNARKIRSDSSIENRKANMHGEHEMPQTSKKNAMPRLEQLLS
ncbi:hypothetical protein DTO195F2_1944 [Paecilomyces variotii]|nr:hypothetical protein DTO195F2_1944 [Paecilomyces variotii]KAJ9303497.1 hypothetical protein DTO217A2_6987 [Paecilomyces variotii]KAJ9373376.1 hypothetical protein DTO282E5_1827 [Paecilomyces variotii]